LPTPVRSMIEWIEYAEMRYQVGTYCLNQHGRTDWNEGGYERILGRADVDLDGIGMKRARLLTT
jgi:hypothetical protein